MRKFSAVLVFFLLVLLPVTFAFGNKTSTNSQMDHTVFTPLMLSHHDDDRPPPLFGMQIYGSSTPNSRYSDALMDSRANWIRNLIRWKQVELVNSTPEDYTWTVADRNMSAASSGYNIIVTLTDNPDWASTSINGPLDLVPVSEWGEFVGAVVERYDGDGIDDAPGSPIVEYFEIYNEPDAGSVAQEGIRFGLFPEKYVELLQVSYQAMKAANPSAKLVFGGVAHDWYIEDNGPFIRTFVEDVLDLGGADYFDIMNIHYYPTFSHTYTSSGPGLLEKIEFVRQKMVSRGIHKPIVVTETGWHDNVSVDYPWTSPEVQARYAVEMIVQSFAADIDIMIYWMLWDPGGNYPFDTGLVTADDDYKPAMFAYQQAVEQLTTADFVRAIPQAELGVDRLDVYVFSDDAYNRDLYVAWVNEVDSTATRQFKVPASFVTTKNIYGAAQTIHDAADGVADGFVDLTITAQPVYIEVTR